MHRLAAAQATNVRVPCAASCPMRPLHSAQYRRSTAHDGHYSRPDCHRLATGWRRAHHPDSASGHLGRCKAGPAWRLTCAGRARWGDIWAHQKATKQAGPRWPHKGSGGSGAALSNSDAVGWLPFGAVSLPELAALQHAWALSPDWLQNRLQDLDVPADSAIFLDTPTWPAPLSCQPWQWPVWC